MKNYLNTLLSEKGISQERIIEVEGPEWGTNFITVSAVVDFIDSLDAINKANVKAKFIQIDFFNGDIMHFMNYIAKGMTMKLTQE